jgi:hypothetical protein
MATKEQHLAQVEKNEALAQHLAGNEEFAWALTLIFYAAVHLISVYFAQRGAQFKTHAARENAMRRLYEFEQVRRHDDELKRESEFARYDCKPVTVDGFQRSRLRYGRLQGHMQRMLSDV